MTPTQPSGMYPGSPDLQPVTAGRGLLSATRNDLTRDIDGQITDARSVLDRARYALRSDADLVIADAQGAVNGATKQLENRIISVLSNAGVVAMEHGIDLPPISEIRTRKSFAPPSILESAPGFGPNPTIQPTRQYGPITVHPTDETGPGIPVVPGGQGGPGVLRCTCDVHKVIDPVAREQFRWVYRKIDGKYYVCNQPINNALDLQTYTAFYIALNWWQAELVCHAMNDCGWTTEVFQTYEAIIRHVDLFQGQSGVNMGAFCANIGPALTALGSQLGV